MPFVLDPHSGVPVYRQLIDQIRYQIAGGLLKPGDELPSIRALSEPLGVNPMTISKAYNLLVREELLERRPGKPLVVAAQSDGDLRSSRLDQLRESLRPAVAMVDQFGFAPDEAERLFGELLRKGRKS
jgi:GntR family transcriptional regulator